MPANPTHAAHEGGTRRGRSTLPAMNVERMRSLLLSLPHVVETMHWGENLLFRVGDKAIGGRMFALLALDAAEGSGRPLFSFAAGPEGFAELCEREGVVPAPYLARAYWVAVMSWDVFSGAEWRALLDGAHARVYARLPARARAVLAMPEREQRRVVRERQSMLCERASAKAK